MKAQLLVLAKAPVPGTVKTRLCPPCSPEQAARVAAAALSDTLATAGRTPATRRVIVLSGQYERPPGWSTVAQRGDGLGARIAHAFADTVMPSTPSLLIGMDTPQVTPPLLDALAARLSDADAVLGPAEDGGWWALALRDPSHASALRDVPMSTSDTGRHTAAALRSHGLRVCYAEVLRDVDNAADAHLVAARCQPGAFTAAVHANVPVAATR